MTWRERDHPRDGEGKFRDKDNWARRISDSIGLPSAKDLLQHNQDQESAGFPELGREFEGAYGRGGAMLVSDVGVMRLGGGPRGSRFSPLGHLSISGKIDTADEPSEGGYFRVTASQMRANKETDPLRWSAHIDRMHVRGSAQGTGGGRELTDRFVDWFRRSGFDEVTVGPSEVGSYAWGAMGFDFEDHESRRIAWAGAMSMDLGQVRDWFRHSGVSYGLSDTDLTDAQIKRMIRQYQRAATIALAGGMSYQRLSQYGRRGQPSSGMWAGKLGLLVGGVGGGRIKL